MLSPIKSSASPITDESGDGAPPCRFYLSDIDDVSPSRAIGGDSCMSMQSRTKYLQLSSPRGVSVDLDSLKSIYAGLLPDNSQENKASVLTNRFIAVYRMRCKLALIQNTIKINGWSIKVGNVCASTKIQYAPRQCQADEAAKRIRSSSTPPYVVDLYLAGKGAGLQHKNIFTLPVALFTKNVTKGPSFCSWITLCDQFFAEDDPVLRFKPYFGDNDQDDVVSANFKLTTKHEWLQDRKAELEEELDYFILKEVVYLLHQKANKNTTKHAALWKLRFGRRFLHLIKLVALERRGIFIKTTPSPCNVSNKKRKSTSCDDNENHESPTTSLILDSYNVLFCRSCKLYDCKKHNHSYESLKFWKKHAIEEEKRSSQKLIDVKKTIISSEDNKDFPPKRIWTVRYKIVAVKVINVCRGDIYRAVNFLGHRIWDWQRLNQKFNECGLGNLVKKLAINRKYENQRGRLKRKIRRRKISSTLYSEMKSNSNDVANRFLPCSHDEICCKTSCVCSKNGHFCMKQCMLSNLLSKHNLLFLL
jgi:hypothetical protein